MQQGGAHRSKAPQTQAHTTLAPDSLLIHLQQRVLQQPLTHTHLSSSHFVWASCVEPPRTPSVHPLQLQLSSQQTLWVERPWTSSPGPCPLQLQLSHQGALCIESPGTAPACTNFSGSCLARPFLSIESPETTWPKPTSALVMLPGQPKQGVPGTPCPWQPQFQPASQSY